MRRAVISGVLVLSLAMMAGCRWDRRHSGGTAIGGIGGAGLGALIGAAAGDWGTGAVIGAAGGALAGYLIADATAPDEPEYRETRVRRETTTYTPPPPPPPRSSSSADRRELQAKDYFDKGLRSTSRQESYYYLQKSIELYPTPEAHNNLGLMYLQDGNRAAAERQWQLALGLDPDYNPAHQNLAKLRGNG